PAAVASHVNRRELRIPSGIQLLSEAGEQISFSEFDDFEVMIAPTEGDEAVGILSMGFKSSVYNAVVIGVFGVLGTDTAFTRPLVVASADDIEEVAVVDN